MKKRILFITLLCAAMLAGCGSKEDSSSKENKETTTSTSDSATDAPETAESAAEETDVQTDESEEEYGIIEMPDDRMEVTYDGSYEFEGKKLETVGDIIALQEVGKPIEIFSNGVFYCGFIKDGTAVRALANMSDEEKKQYDELDIFDEDYNDKYNAIMLDLKISQLDDISSEMIPQEELDSYIGKTGQEVLDAGFEQNGYAILEGSTIFTLAKGQLTYDFTFNEDISQEETDPYDSLKSLTVKEVKCAGMNLF